MMLLGAIVCGFLLDLVIGDPHGWPHPIILIGKLIARLEKQVRKVSGTVAAGGPFACDRRLFPFFYRSLRYPVCGRSDSSLASFCVGNDYVLPDFLHPLPAG